MPTRNHQRSKSNIDPQPESSATATLRAELQKSASSPAIHKGKSKPRSNSSTTAADSGISIKSKPSLTEGDWYYKQKPTRQVCKLQVVSYTSAYTRPAVDLMREVLEVRYPEPPATSRAIRCYGVTGQETEESRPLLMTTLLMKRGWFDGLRSCGRRAWSWRRILDKRHPGRQADQSGSGRQ